MTMSLSEIFQSLLTSYLLLQTFQHEIQRQYSVSRGDSSYLGNVVGFIKTAIYEVFSLCEAPDLVYCIYCHI